jgi:hypothetical protein
MVKGSHFVKTIRKPDFFTGFRMVWPFENRTESVLTSSLDRYGMNKIFFIPKRSKLVRKYPVQFTKDKNKMAAILAAILFLPFENQIFVFGFLMVH